ncbi:hypothetical protein Prede_2028 [Prevotella dentalis DSM 3688]|uniref:Uncharacterized protein n=1 Tax=Prevotella dentalis (strain ATCC 49559 / DSM 3688 / JCM 13448 / NCTC 12043 / ES 2772) TaxID=908937 RepID=L0JCS7_PREDD|nr:hypothetical protein Prede_2028 [Prevotella dentalis DSM 3688]
MALSKNNGIFAADSGLSAEARNPAPRPPASAAVTRHRQTGMTRKRWGLTGFDSRMRRYVSTRRLVGYLLKLSEQQFNWRKQLRSRCLIEA